VHRFTDGDADGWLVHFAADHFVRSEQDAGLLMHLRILAGQQPAVRLGDATFVQTLATLVDEHARTPRDVEVERSLLDVLLRTVVRALPEAGRDDVVLRFLARVEERYAAHDPVGTYAKALGMSERGLFEATRRALGKTPGEVLVERVMLEARRLLVHSGERVSQIAYALGFSDPGYFARLFKKHVGQTPSAYRDGR
jgi:AraC-like DNA-binding protein